MSCRCMECRGDRKLLWSLLALAVLVLSCHPRQLREAPDTDTTSAEAPPPPRYFGWDRETPGSVGDELYPVAVPLETGTGTIFSSDRHGSELKLYLAGEQGRTVRQLTFGAGDDIHPALTDDGARLAFASNRGGGWRLYLIEDLDDPRPRRLGDDDNEAVHPSWSPDGSQVAYSRFSAVSGRWEVWILDLDSGQQRFLVEGLFADFHPTEERLVLQQPRRRDERWYSIWTIESDGSRPRMVVEGGDWGAVNPCWSPDGRWIAFNSVARSRGTKEQPPDRGDDLWCVQAHGEGLTQLSFSPSAEWNPHWAADGRIYFNAATPTPTVWSLRAEPERLTTRR